VLEILDDGAGFDPKAPGHLGFGLRNLEARAQGLQAHFRIESSPGKGSRVVVELPQTTLHGHN